MSSLFLVTGGAGFIGSHLVLKLAQTGHHVRVLDNFSSRPRGEFEALLGPWAKNIQIIESDIRDPDACRAAVIGASHVLHHAAMASVQASISSPAECISINVVGTANLLRECVRSGTCERFVVASSSAVYGDLPPNVKSETATVDPLTPYATSKLSVEFLCRNYSQIEGLATVSLRYFNVFGPRQDPNGPYAAVIPRFIESLSDGRTLKIFGDGEQSRDFVAVEDVVQANLLACEAPESAIAGKVLNIGSGRKTSLNELVSTLGKIVDKRLTVDYLPARSGDILHSLSDIDLAKRLLGYCPGITLEQGLRSLISGT